MTRQNDPDQRNESLEAAFIRLWSLHSPRVHAFALAALCEQHAADDVLQETGVVAWERFSEFAQGTDFLAWVMAIARLRIHEIRRRSKRFVLADEVIESLADDTVQFSSELSHQFELLKSCLKQLSEPDQLLIRLRYGEGRDVASIAVAMNRTKWTVYKMLGRVHEALLRCVSRSMHESERLS